MRFIKIFLIILSTILFATLTSYLTVKKLFYKQPPFIFTSVGDYGNTLNTDGVLDGISKSGSKFNLGLGDLSYGSISESEWCKYVKDHVGQDMPFELVIGNHDDGSDSDISKYIDCLPNKMGGFSGSYPNEYYFDYNGIARFIQISPNIRYKNEVVTFVPGNEHYKWLSDAIDSAHDSGIYWVVVTMHENCITAANKECEVGADLFNLLIQKKVDLILQGHDHSYQRSNQLSLNDKCKYIYPGEFNKNCIKEYGSSFIKGNGSVVVINGVGGQSIYDINYSDPEIGYFSKYMGANLNPSYGFTKISVSHDQLIGRFVNTTQPNGFTDFFTISKNKYSSEK